MQHRHHSLCCSGGGPPIIAQVVTVEPVNVGPTMTQRQAARVALILLIGACINGIFAIIGFVGGRGGDSGFSLALAVLYFGTGMVGREATKTQRRDKAKQYSVLMWITCVVNILLGIVGLVFAVIAVTGYSEAEEDAAKARDENYAGKMARTIGLVVSAIGLVITLVVCPMFGAQIRRYKEEIERAESEIASMPTIGAQGAGAPNAIPQMP